MGPESDLRVRGRVPAETGRSRQAQSGPDSIRCGSRHQGGCSARATTASSSAASCNASCRSSRRRSRTRPSSPALLFAQLAGFHSAALARLTTSRGAARQIRSPPRPTSSRKMARLPSGRAWSGPATRLVGDYKDAAAFVAVVAEEGALRQRTPESPPPWSPPSGPSSLLNRGPSLTSSRWVTWPRRARACCARTASITVPLPAPKSQTRPRLDHPRAPPRAGSRRPRPPPSSRQSLHLFGWGSRALSP